jgi:hypothetical protein
MSNIGAIIDYIESAMNKILEAVGQLENRIMALEQRIYDVERASAGPGAYGAPSPSRREPMAQAPVMQDTRRAPPPSPPAPQPQPYAPPQQQWGAPRQDSYSQPQTPSYQSRPPAPSYPPQGQQQPAPQGYAPQGYGPPGQPPQQQGPPGPRPPASALNIRQEMTGELKDIFARMRARAEGRQ